MSVRYTPSSDLGPAGPTLTSSKPGQGWGKRLLTAETIDVRTWRPAGPKAQAYGVCPAPICAIVGPTGGGKTTESARRYLRVASWQHPSPRDGIRKARILCICPTYRRAWDQVIPSYFSVFPESLGTFRGSRGDPADHVFDLEINTGLEIKKLHVETLFRAVNDLDIEDFFRGFLFTAVHLPEADTNGDLAQILSLGSNRAGRYPEPHDRPDQADSVAYRGIWCDANAPIIGTAFHTRFYLKRMPDGSPAPATDRLFTQPSGFSPNAENMGALKKINPNYYRDMAAQLDAYDRARMIENKPGFGRHGQPVHPNFDHTAHVAGRELTPDPALDVVIGVDCGSNALTPGATFSQRGYSGQWRTFAEIFLAKGQQMNTEVLSAEILHVLNARFPHRRKDAGAVICADPVAGGKNAMTEYTTAMALQHHTEIEVMLAPTNRPKDRHGAVDRLFLKNVAPGEPGKVIDPGCIGLIQGYAGGYHYQRRGQIVGVTPVKNEFSHVVEADEYAALTIDGMDADESRFIAPGGERAAAAPQVLYD